MAIYSVKSYQSTHKELWNDFVNKAKNATFLFQRDFMDYHKDRFQDASVLVFKKDELIAVFPANAQKDQIISHQGLSYGGLVLKSKVYFSDVLLVFQAILEFYHSEGIQSMTIKTLPRIYNRMPSDEIDYLLFKLEASLVRRDVTSVIGNDTSSLGRSSNRERGLKKALKNNLELRESQGFEEFWNSILIPNLKQKHKTSPTHSLDEITLLKEKFPNHIRQFNAYKNDRLVAGVTIFETEQVAHAQYISAGEDKQELGSLDFVFDKLINDIFRDKPYFDFGISNENNGQHINEGLLKWKEDFGARTVVHDHYQFSTENYKNLKSVFI
ncbi:MAG: GNAT family N-acetyltransferase [Flavobacteriaceae bacterium]|nr:GNAT family N-acetyltransferase [Flavobacteriaceae bacterium]